MFLHTPLVLVLEPFPAGSAWTDFPPARRDTFSLDPLFFNLIEGTSDQPMRASVLVGTPVRCNAFHVILCQGKNPAGTLSAARLYE
jgi:hypothetical protein